MYGESAPRDQWGNSLRKYRCLVQDSDYWGTSFWHEFWAEDRFRAEARMAAQFPGKRIDYLTEQG